MHCSILLNSDISMRNVFFKNTISPLGFIILNITIVIFSIINDIFLYRISKKKKSGFMRDLRCSLFIAYCHLFRYLLMMLTMTGNVYIIGSYIISRFISTLITRKKEVEECC
ncbi:uncharacterized protein VNE69_12159 [Vairimorpha necatrix]|uniref:Membrane protein n=1 Tax=Vairimorpha necatrix TaxID=6039 RepID=A0AAX4JGT5_9MICR